jgi:phosphonate transport system permease protein
MAGTTSIMAPPRPPGTWHLQTTIGPRGWLAILALVVVCGWSFHRMGLDRAAIQIGASVTAGVGLTGPSELGGGIGRFVVGMWPFAIGETTEVGRIEGFDPASLPWFSHLETVTTTEKAFNTTTMAWEERSATATMLVQPVGYLWRIVGLMIATIEMAFWATVIAVCLAAPLGVLGARTLGLPGPVVSAARGVASFLRALPELVLAMILVLGFGFGPVPGILALGLHSAGFFGKFFADDVENADKRPQEALRAGGASRLQVLRMAVIPQVWPQYIAYIQYILERNVRTATIIGIVGAGGIGVELKGRFEMFHYQHVATILLAIFVTVVALEHIVGHIRKRLI